MSNTTDPFFNNASISGYVYYDLSQFSNKNIAMIQINQYPHNQSFYLIPKSINVASAFADGSYINYLAKPVTTSISDNNGLYLIVNKTMLSMWSSLSWYGQNVKAYEVPSGVSAQSTVDYNMSDDFEDFNVVFENSSVAPVNITPKNTCPPFVFFKGRPIISYQKYISAFKSLSNYSFDTPSYEGFSMKPWSNTDLPPNVTLDQFETIVSAYSKMLSQVAFCYLFNGLSQFADGAIAFTSSFLSQLESILSQTTSNGTSNETGNNANLGTPIISSNRLQLTSQVSSNAPSNPWQMWIMTVTANDPIDKPSIYSYVNQGALQKNFQHGSIYQYVQSSWNSTSWTLNYTWVEPGSNGSFYVNNIGPFNVENAGLDLANYSSPIWNCNFPSFSGSSCQQCYQTTPSNPKLPGNFLYGSSNLGPNVDQHWYLASNGAVNVWGSLPKWQWQVNVATQPYWVWNSNKASFIQFPILATSTDPYPVADIIYTATGSGANGLSYIALENYYAEVYSNNLSYNYITLNAQYPTAILTIPGIDIDVSYLSSKIPVSDDKTELEKLGENYYSIADLMVSGYYNSLLQKVHYVLTNQNQAAAPSPLQAILALAEKYNFTRDLLTEWVNGHPFKSVPSTTQQLQFAYNNSQSTQNISDEDMLDGIDSFFNLVIPDSVNAFKLNDNDNVSQSLSNAYAEFLSVTGETSDILSTNADIPTLMPSVFRECITKIMGMGAMLHIYHSFFSLLKLHQLSLKSYGFTDSNGEGILPALDDQTSNSSDVAQNALSLDKARFDMEQHVSSNLKPLIYPLFNDVIDSIQSDVQAIRYLTEGRLHGMSFDLYQPEIKALMSHRIKLTHEFLHLFIRAAHTAEDIVNDVNDLGNYLNSKLAKPLDTLFLKPLTHTFVLIAKFAASAVLDMTHLVSPGSEILTIMADTNIMRPMPFPLSPWGTSGLFSKAIANETAPAGVLSLSDVDCIIPYVGLANRSSANCGFTSYNPLTKTYSISIGYGTKTDSDGNVVNSDGTPTVIKLTGLTKGLHCFRMLTTAGSVRMWVSPNLQYDSTASNGFSQIKDWVDGDSSSINPNATKDMFLISGSFIAFVPDPVVSLDERIDLVKTFHKWIITGLALPGLFYKGSQTESYVAAVKSLDSIPGFENLTTHVSTAAFTAGCAADAAASTEALLSGILNIVSGYGFKSSLEGFAQSAEDLLNIASITSIYLKANSQNVLNSWYNNNSQIVSTLQAVWPTNVIAQYSLKYYQLFNRRIVENIDPNVPAWYGESWGRVFGDVLLGVAKIAFFLHAQHKAFKKWASTDTDQKKNQVSVMAMLKNKIKNKWNRHKTVAGVTDAIKKLNKSFGGKADTQGLHTFELSSSKNIRSILSDDTSMISLIKNLSTDSGARGIN